MTLDTIAWIVIGCGVLASMVTVVHFIILDLEEKERALRKKPLKKEIVEDGHGAMWSAHCPECGEKTMHVVRPGKVQCGNCG